LLKALSNHSVAGRIPVRIQAGAFLAGAHHPHCDRYSHHLIWIGRRPICLGCMSAAIGALLGLLAAFSITWANVSVGAWALGHLLALSPTAVQPWVQRKYFKMWSRALLGATVVSYSVTGALLIRVPVNRPLWLLLMALMFWAVYAALCRLRDSQTDDPCEACPLGRYPTCDWNLPRLLQDPAIDPELREALQSNSVLHPTPDGVIMRG
jgi:hypothetical protein